MCNDNSKCSSTCNKGVGKSIKKIGCFALVVLFVCTMATFLISLKYPVYNIVSVWSLLVSLLMLSVGAFYNKNQFIQKGLIVIGMIVSTLGFIFAEHKELSGLSW